MPKTDGHFIKNGQHHFWVRLPASFIRLRLNTPQLAAGMKGEVNRAEAHQSEGGLKFEPVDKSRLSGTQKLSKKGCFAKVSLRCTEIKYIYPEPFGDKYGNKG